MAEAEQAAKTAKKKPSEKSDEKKKCNCPDDEKKKTDDDFKVEKGQLTFDAEGQEGGRYHSRQAHWPGGKSGVTLGRGYDMGDRTRAEVIDDLTGAGVSRGAAEYYAGGAGLKGQKAGDWVAQNRDCVVQITPAQQKSLFSTTYAEQEAEVRRISSKPDVVKKYGATCWENLDPKIRDSLVDLKYRGDYTGTSRGFLQEAVANNDVDAFGAAMRDRSNWPNVPADRLDRRVNYWN